VTIPLLETAEEGALEDSQRASDGRKRTVGMIFVGSGAAIAAAGGILGMQAIVKGRDINAECPGTANTCANQSAVNQNATARTYATLSTVLLPVGAAAAVAGGVILLTTHGSVEAAVTPTGANLAFRWQF
jgi:hypothetical protein